jgi:TolB-like protein
MAGAVRKGVVFGPFRLDESTRSLTRAGVLVALRGRTFDLLCALAASAGGTVSKDDLLAHVWPGLTVEENNLQVHISTLRKTLGEGYIVTVPGRGYRLLADTAIAEHDAELSGEKPSIAVLPFANLNGDPDKTYFSHGIVAEIITALARFRNLLVIARNSSFAYEGKAIDVRQVGRELGVRYVLEGSVRQAGDRVRITAQLLETDGGHHLWADRYERRLEDIFAIQDEITASIVGRLDPEILSAEYARISRKAPPNLSAWECVVRAFHHSSRRSEEETRRALQYLESALRHDPDYAQALGMKARTLIFRALQGWEDMGRILKEVQPIIAHAMAVNNEELWPHLAQGMVGFATRDNALSMSALTRAVELSPNSVNAHGLLANAHSFGGRSTEALCLYSAGETAQSTRYLSVGFRTLQRVRSFSGRQLRALPPVRAAEPPLAARPSLSASSWRLERWTPR